MAVGTVVGVSTVYGQAWLPDVLAPLANSSGSWSVVAFAVALLAPNMRTAVAVGVLTLAASLAGYVIGAGLRGYSSSQSLIVFWTLAALLVGPVLGLAASTMVRRSPQVAALAAGVVAGILIGEGAYGLRVVAETTPAGYWWAQMAVAVLWLLVTAVRVRRPAAAATAVVAAAVVAIAFGYLYERGFGLLW